MAKNDIQPVENNQADVFVKFLKEAIIDNSRETVIKKLLASGRAKRLNSLNVRNVVATTYDTETGSHTLLILICP